MPRVQIPGPRPVSSSKSAFPDADWSRRITAGSRIPGARLQPGPRSGDCRSRSELARRQSLDAHRTGPLGPGLECQLPAVSLRVLSLHHRRASERKAQHVVRCEHERDQDYRTRRQRSRNCSGIRRAESSGVGGVLKAPRATVATPELTVAAYVFKTNATPVWLKAHRRASAAHQGSD